jgi:putative ABC transport system permease protein
MQDIRFAFRILLKNPGFSALAIFTLALGIAGSVVIFSVFNGLFLRPLPFQESERLVNLDEVAPKWNLEYTGIAYPDFHEWRAQNQTFESMGVWQEASFNFSIKGNPERVEGGRASHDLLTTLGIQPLLGRGFTEEEDRPGGTRVALVSQGLWQRLWGGQSNVLGQALSLDSVPATIIGVLPAQIGPLDRAEVLIPLRLSVNDNNGWYLEGAGRLKPGVTLEQARQDLTRIHKAMIPNRSVNDITSPRLTSLRERLLGDYRLVTYVLIAAVAVVWLIACANVAGLTLARGLGRSKEISIRMALGATRHSVIRQVLAESLVLSVIGGLLGVALGQSSLGALVRVLPEQFPQWLHFGMDGRFVVFCLVTTAATAMVFGLIPAVQMVSRVNLQGALQATTCKSTGSSNQRRSLNALVIGEIALALVLLVNAGLLLQAFRGLQKMDPGFRPENVLTYDLSLPRAKYTNNQQVAFFEEHLERVRALPGVKAASATTIVPLGGHSGTFYEAENALPKAKDEQDPVVLYRHVFPGYAEAIGLTLLGGHFLTEQEARATNHTVVVVNEMFAKRYWPTQDAVGKRIRAPGPSNPWLTIVGVSKDEKHYGFDQPMRPGIFLPYRVDPQRRMTIVVRGLTDPQALLPAIRSLIQKTDPDLPIFQVRTMSERVKSSLWLRRSYSWLFGFFAAVALTMALAGVYGVISYAVSQRTNEIGIRMALGAQRTDVLRLVLRHGLMLAGVGTAIGLAGALALSHSMRTLLFGVSAVEPVTLFTVPLLLLVVTLIACLFPARKATRVDPMVALRYE